ncbi:MAG: DUF5813 family protein [Halanaeroarchaeum sp.]
MNADVRTALAAHEQIEERGDAFVPTETTFEACVTVEGDRVRVESAVPTLDAVVDGETVAPVVEDGWLETFERRVRNVDGVTRAEEAAVATVERRDSSVTVVVDLRSTPDTVGDDVVAVDSFVEGTWMEGIVPGYDYVDRVQQLRERARQNAQSP